MDALSTSRFRTGLGDVGPTSKWFAGGRLGLRRATGWFEARDGLGSGWLRRLERGGWDARSNRAGFDGFQGNAGGLGGHVCLILIGGPLAFGRGMEGWVDILRVDVFQGLSLARDGRTWMIRRVRSTCNMWIEQTIIDIPLCLFWKFMRDLVRERRRGASRAAKGWRGGVMVTAAMTVCYGKYRCSKCRYRRCSRVGEVELVEQEE